MWRRKILEIMTVYGFSILVVLNIFVMYIVLVALAGTKGKLDIVEVLLKAEEKRRHFKGLEPKSKEWIDVRDELPSCENGCIDALVLIRVKNKNQPDGIWLYDVSWYTCGEWGKRGHTWEKITHWKTIK